MDVQFHEKYVPLSDMTAGQTAVSKDREAFFVCGWHMDALARKNKLVIHDMNNLHNQYTEKRDMSQPVKILKAGDKFTCSA